MPMNEYGEIIRSGSATGATDSSAEECYGYTGSFSNEVEDRFLASRKRNFNLITLIIGIPLYVVLGYFAGEYVLYEYVSETTPAMVVGGIAALIIILIYNNVFARAYKGIEYLISLLSPGIVFAAIVLVIIIVMIVIQILLAIVGIIIVIAILAGLMGG